MGVLRLAWVLLNAVNWMGIEYFDERRYVIMEMLEHPEQCVALRGCQSGNEAVESFAVALLIASRCSEHPQDWFRNCVGSLRIFNKRDEKRGQVVNQRVLGEERKCRVVIAKLL